MSPLRQHPPSQSTSHSDRNTRDHNQQSQSLNANAPIFIPSNSQKVKKYESKIDAIEEEPASFDTIPSKCRGTVIVSRQLTENIIPNSIAENIYNVYDFMDKSMAFCNNKKAVSGQGIIIINFNFHSKHNSTEILFCVIVEEKQFRGRRWRMLDQLFTAKMLKDKYGISDSKLPMAFLANNCIEAVKQTLSCDEIMHDIINNTKWSKIKINPVPKKKQRRVLHITNREFIRVITKQMMNNERVLPIIIFDCKLYWTEYVLVIHLTEQLSIGVSLTLQPLRVTGIYLDKNEILRYHQLISPQHECNCLADFVSNLDELEIGNIYDKENQIKALRKEIENLRKENQKLKEDKKIKN